MNETLYRYTRDIALVSDVRYATYPNDELGWVLYEHEGLLVHLRRYEKSSSAVIEADGSSKLIMFKHRMNTNESMIQKCVKVSFQLD